MNLPRILLAAFGAFVAYFALGSLAFTRPAMKNEFLKYPAVYRSEAGIRGVMPAGMAAMFVAMVALAALYAMIAPVVPGAAAGARFGALIGIFAVCSFVIHNHVNLNIGLTLTLQQAVAYFLEWLVVGVVIGLLYRPPASH